MTPSTIIMILARMIMLTRCLKMACRPQQFFTKGFLRTLLGVIVASSLWCSNATAVQITFDFGTLGPLQLDSQGFLHNDQPASTDILPLFKADALAAKRYFEKSILLPWDETVNFIFGPTQNVDALAEAGISMFDSNKRPSKSTITLSNNSSYKWFFDATPFGNSEFPKWTDSTASLGGATVNVGRYGSTTFADSPAKPKYDFFSVILHELEHSLGINDQLALFANLVGAPGPPHGNDRSLTIPKTLTGLSTDFSIPFLSNVAHIDSAAAAGVFAHTLEADTGQGISSRQLPTAVDFYAICAVVGCDASQVKPNLHPAAEPETLLLIVVGLAALIVRASGQGRR